MGDHKYGICFHQCTIQLVPLNLNNTGFLSVGTLFQIHQQINAREVLIKRLTYINRNHINYENETYICAKNYFKEIDYRLFLLLLAVKPNQRIDLVLDDQFLNFIKTIRENMIVSIPKHSFRERQSDFDCVVRYIGAVPEIGLGIYFGFIIIDPNDSIPVRGTLAQKYLRCDNSKGFLRSMDVMHRRPQAHHNPLRSFPSVSSIDPYGSMESLSSEQSTGSINNHPNKRNNANNRNRNKKKGMTIFNSDNTNESGSGMNLINFEPVNPNYIKPNTPREPLRPANCNSLLTNMPVPNIIPPLFPSLVPLQYQLPKSNPLLSFTPVPNNMVQNIIQKSNVMQNRDKYRQKYELLKKELEQFRNSKMNGPNETVQSNKKQAAVNSNQMHVTPENKNKCQIKWCISGNQKRSHRIQNEYLWDGNTEYYTNSNHLVKCCDCQELKLKCYTTKLYGVSQEFSAFVNVLKESGFNVSFPENKYLAITDQDKTKMFNKQYYSCNIRANITINKNRNRSHCIKCNAAVDVSQGISLASCHHLLCSNCIKAHIHSSKTPVIKCPIEKCLNKLNENEIHAFMNDNEFKLHLERLKEAENMFYCKNGSCNTCIPFNRNNRDKFVLLCCPKCGQFNCIDCDTIHTGLKCEEYKQKMLQFVTAKKNTVTRNKIFKCKLDKCKGYLQINQNETNLIACPECSNVNCCVCEDIHVGMTCRENQRYKLGAHGIGQNIAEYNDDAWACYYCTYIHNEKMDRCKMCQVQRRVVNEPLENNELDNEYDYNDSENTDDVESISSVDEYQYEDEMDIIRTTSPFQCIICYCDVEIGKGVKLHDCLHEFCEECLTGLIKASDQAPIMCPFRDNDNDCEGTLQHREMKYLVDDDVFEQYLYRSLLHAQKDLNNCFQCKTPDCRGMWEYEDNVADYMCGLCKEINCHQCNAIHGTMSCREYQQKIYDETNPEALATRKMYEEMFANGKALRCPQCQIVIVREEGCSWVLCILCKTEICWVTRGPRWGPKGKGDTSGGCRCDYKNQKPCHPECAYCH